MYANAYLNARLALARNVEKRGNRGDRVSNERVIIRVLRFMQAFLAKYAIKYATF